MTDQQLYAAAIELQRATDVLREATLARRQTIADVMRVSAAERAWNAARRGQQVGQR